MFKRTLIAYFLIAFCACTLPVFGQKPITIKLDNPSFEDYPQAAHTPQGWFDCGFAGESAPDVQPSGTFSVNKPAFHGSTYLGMVVRDNNTWEAIGQRLKSPLLKGVTYTFSLNVARSELYTSQSKMTGKEANYITPATVRIWAGSGYCAKEEMLDETEPVSEGNWKKFTFKFTPKIQLNYFMIEAFYKVPTLFPYNGNVLIDNASDIVPEIKDDKKPPVVAAVIPKPKPTLTPPAVKPPAVKPKPTTKPADTSPIVTQTKPTKPDAVIKPIDEPSQDRLREGQTIKIEKLQFEPNSSKIQESSHASLDDVFNLLINNSNLIVEIGGHTNLVMEDVASVRLSTDRAKAVADYLVNKGIERKRLAVKGYGGSKPIEKEKTQAANKINQRVEIKILSTNG
jgi:outer membrane protein OmpA-like peptidoglycan-associated protein